MPHCKAQLQLQPAVQLLEQQVPGSSALAAKVSLLADLDMDGTVGQICGYADDCGSCNMIALHQVHGSVVLSSW